MIKLFLLISLIGSPVTYTQDFKTYDQAIPGTAQLLSRWPPFLPGNLKSEARLLNEDVGR